MIVAGDVTHRDVTLCDRGSECNSPTASGRCSPSAGQYSSMVESLISPKQLVPTAGFGDDDRAVRRCSLIAEEEEEDEDTDGDVIMVTIPRESVCTVAR